MSASDAVSRVPSELDRTHQLESERFPEAFRSLVESTLPYATDAVVRLREDEAATDPDGDECRRAWEAVRDRFERAADEDRYGATAWRCGTAADGGRAALSELVGLASGIAGRHFLFEVTLLRDGAPVLNAIPHTPSAGVDATHFGGEVRPGEVASLDGHAACLVPDETRAEWTAAERRWSVRGGSLCVETLDGRKTSCDGLRNLRRLEADGGGTALALAWGTGEFPDDPVGRVLSWVTGRLYRPPPAVPCGTAARAAAVEELVRETLVAYDGREL